MHKMFNDLIAIDNLLQAWMEFRKGKKKRVDLQVFERYLEENLFALQQALRNKTYRHGNYQAFYVHDPKKRQIHKASVQDRIVHHLLYKYLYDIFDKTFIYDSYSCRLDKGTHKAVRRLEIFTRKVSRNYTRQCWALKCDIKKFFASVDHQVLLELLKKRITDKDILWLLQEVIESFCTCHSGKRSASRIPSRSSGQFDSGQARMTLYSCKGIPLGNLTSQVFANIYLNELDYFIKHDLRIRYYLRYADDFLLLSSDKDRLQRAIVPIEQFLKTTLKMELHSKKIIFRDLRWGIDVLGYIVLPHYVLPRTKTKKRVFMKLKEKINASSFEQSLQSYLGYLRHANSYELTQKLKNQIWFWASE